MAAQLADSQTEMRRAEPGARLFDPGGGGTLDDMISRVTSSLSVRGNAHCLVCGATFVRQPQEEAEAPLASCAACGSRLE